MARPTKYRKRYCKMVRDWGSQGYSIKYMAYCIGVPRDALYRWADKYPEFEEALSLAREFSEAVHEKLAGDAAKGEIEGYNINAHRFYMKHAHGWEEQEKEPQNKNNITIGSVNIANLANLPTQELDKLIQETALQEYEKLKLISPEEDKND